MGKRSKMLVCLLFIMSNICMPTSGFSGEIYKWIDAEGNIHYGDKPRSKNASEVQIDKAPPKDVYLEERKKKQGEYLSDIKRNKRFKKDTKDVLQTWDNFLSDLGGKPRKSAE